MQKSGRWLSGEPRCMEHTEAKPWRTVCIVASDCLLDAGLDCWEERKGAYYQEARLGGWRSLQTPELYCTE